MKAEFDQFAKDYHQVLSDSVSISGETSLFFTQYKAQKLHQWVSKMQSTTIETILDFGCGDGLMTHAVQKRFPHATMHGVDPSPESIKVAQKNHPRIQFKVSEDNLRIFKDNTFDLIFSAGVFHHIPFNQHKKYVKEIARILKPNGIMVLFELNPLNPGTQYIFRNSPIDQNATMLKPWYAKKIFQSFGNITTKYYGFFPNFLKKLRFAETFIEWLPLGALYAIILKKD